MHVPDTALKRFGDTKRVTRIRNERREKFLEGSVVTRIMYHGTVEDFSFPVFAVTDLGMHFGSKKSAMERVEALEERKKQDDPSFRAFVKGYYINIKNPLIVGRDLGVWDNPRAWYNNTVEDAS